MNIEKESILLNNKKQYNIFFIETNISRNDLSMKEFCAIESAALNNPNSRVLLYSLKASLRNENIDLLNAYDNIVYVKLEPGKLNHINKYCKYMILNLTLITRESI